MVLPLMLLSLAMVMWAGSAFAYWIDDTTLVGKETTGGGITGPGDWVDVIANEPTDFNVIGIDITLDAGYFNFDFYTNFNDGGDYLVKDNPDPVDDLYAYIADVGIDTDLDGTFDYGFCLKDHDEWDYLGSMWSDDGDTFDNTMEQGVYKITSTGGDGWLTSRNFWEDNSGYTYGGHFAPSYPSGTPPPGAYTIGPNTAIASGEKIGSDYSAASDGVEVSPGVYMWRVTIHEDILKNDPGSHLTPGMGIDPKQTIGILWGGATCANDIIYGTWTADYTDPGDDPIPEPGTLLLLGFGLLGLSGYTIHRKKKS